MSQTQEHQTSLENVQTTYKTYKVLIMRPFDLELWKAGEPVITRMGTPVEQLTFFETRTSSEFKLVGTAKGDIYTWTVEGKQLLINESDFDLFHPEPEMWVNVYKEGDSIYFSCVYKSQKDAEDGAWTNKFPSKVGTYKLVKP
jgi:hypothetical protein